MPNIYDSVPKDYPKNTQTENIYNSVPKDMPNIYDSVPKDYPKNTPQALGFDPIASNNEIQDEAKWYRAPVADIAASMVSPIIAHNTGAVTQLMGNSKEDADKLVQSLTHNPTSPIAKTVMNILGYVTKPLTVVSQTPVAVGNAIYQGATGEGSPIQNAIQGASDVYNNSAGDVLSNDISAVSEKAAALAKVLPEDTMAAGLLKAGADSPTIKNWYDNPTEDKILTQSGKVGQGTLSDQAKTANSVKYFTPDEIKSVNDIKSGADLYNNKVSDLSNQLSQKLNADHTTYDPSEIIKKVNVGGVDVFSDNVTEGINQLKKWYDSTNDVENAQRMNNLKDKLFKEGLTVSEMNNLAKEHNNVLSAFKPDGSLESSAKAAKFENTRQGIKDTARDLYIKNNPNDTSFIDTDKALSEIIPTRNLLKDQAESVNANLQRWQDSGLAKKTVGLITTAINKISQDAIPQLLKTQSTKGKFLSNIELNSDFSQNLTRLKDLVDRGLPESDLQDRLNKIIHTGEIMQKNETNVPNYINTGTTYNNGAVTTGEQ